MADKKKARNNAVYFKVTHRLKIKVKVEVYHSVVGIALLMGFELLNQRRLTVSIGYYFALQVICGIAAYYIVREIIITFWVKIKSILVNETQ